MADEDLRLHLKGSIAAALLGLPAADDRQDALRLGLLMGRVSVSGSILSPREMDLRRKAAAAADAFAADPRAPFLRAVLTAPADDAPRLVYADWLDEQVEAGRGPAEWGAQAALIRAQIEYDRLPQITPAGEREAVAARASTARAACRRDQWGPLPRCVRFSEPPLTRGFPEALTVNTMAFALRWARAIGTWLPVRRVAVVKAYPNGGRTGVYFEEVETSPFAGRPDVPPRVFRFFDFPRPGFLRLPGQPILQRVEDGTGRRYAIFDNAPAAADGLAAALADYCRAAAGYAPRNNPRALPR